MKVSNSNKMVKNLSIIYFAVAFVYLINEIFKFHPFIYFFGSSLMPILMTLYFFSSIKRNWIYFGILLFAFISDSLFIGSSKELFLYGLLSYMIYRFLTVVLVFKSIKEKSIVYLSIGTLPFLFVYLYIIYFTEELFSVNFYPLMINGLLFSFLGGLCLSNYILDNNNKNLLLLISLLLFMLQNLIFILKRYYLVSGVIEPIAAIIFAISHYTFYRFVIMQEESKVV
jgi:hypothetical protein